MRTEWFRTIESVSGLIQSSKEDNRMVSVKTFQYVHSAMLVDLGLTLTRVLIPGHSQRPAWVQLIRRTTPVHTFLSLDVYAER